MLESFLFSIFSGLIISDKNKLSKLLHIEVILLTYLQCTLNKIGCVVKSAEFTNTYMLK